ncbi:hypothetical protein BsWGS_26445 [Bradybaena similaris]
MLALLVCCLVCFGTTEALYCYQCSASSAEESCVTDTGGMANISTRDIYVKDCTDSKRDGGWDRCMIQTVEVGGKLQFFHRDCHDGSYFPKSLDSPRFYNISTNNLTTCDLIADKVVCYRSCLTDLCNGPRTYVNKTDYCLLYGDGENENVTLPPGVECGACRLHVGAGHFTVFVSSLMVAFLFGNAIKLLSYL